MAGLSWNYVRLLGVLMAIGQASETPFNTRNPGPWFRGLTLLTVLAAFVLIILGGVVRVTESGLGCPDWPLCHGSVIPPLEMTAIIEYSHRLVASALLGPLIVATCAIAWISYRSHRWLVVSAIVGLVMMLAQALLGGATVLTELPGWIVATHLALGEALLACLILVAMVANYGPPDLPDRFHEAGGALGFPILALVSGLGIYLVIISGSIVTGAGATGACSNWPLCQFQLFPGGGLPLIHMSHRVVTLIIGLIFVYTLYSAYRGPASSHLIRHLSAIAAALFVAQVGLGAATVLLHFPAEFRALHLSLATLIWGTVVALAVLSLIKPAPSRSGTSDA